MNASRRLLAPALLLVAVLASALTACGDDDGPAPRVADVVSSYADYDYVIPFGTGERIDQGEQLEILPNEIRARVGEVIRISNRDSRGHMLGPFYVGAGETLTQVFTSAGTFVGECTVDPSGEMTLVVES